MMHVIDLADLGVTQAYQVFVTFGPEFGKGRAELAQTFRGYVFSDQFVAGHHSFAGLDRND